MRGLYAFGFYGLTRPPHAPAERFRRQVMGFHGKCSTASTTPHLSAPLFLSLALCGLLLAAPCLCSGAPVTLRQDTLAAFHLYVKLTDARNAEELKRENGLLWIDTLPDSERAQAYAALKRGEVEMRRLETLNDGEKIHCPDGMIHHWVGLVFIPDSKLENVLSVMLDYNRHAQFYAPDVERSKIEQHDDDHFIVFLRFRRHKVVTVVLDTEHNVHYFHDGSSRAHSRSSATRIAQVENAGKPDEHEKPPGEDDGFMWGMETWWRMVEGDGGVYVQSEVVSLTRDIPAGLGWLIGPFVISIPKESLTFTLEATRKAVQSRRKRD